MVNETEMLKLAEQEVVRLIEMFETDLDRLIMVGHKEGLNYWQLLDIFLRACVQLHLEASAEYQMKQN